MAIHDLEGEVGRQERGEGYTSGTGQRPVVASLNEVMNFECHKTGGNLLIIRAHIRLWGTLLHLIVARERNNFFK